jgi:hypothetical protein
MKFIIFSIDTHVEEFLFIFEYAKGENKIVLGELVKLNNLCYIKDFDLDFFEIVEDPNYALNKEGIYIYKYNTFSDVLHRLNLKLTSSEIQELRMKNREIFNILTKKSKSEILSIIHEKNENHDLFKKMFEPRNKKK